MFTIVLCLVCGFVSGFIIARCFPGLNANPNPKTLTKPKEPGYREPAELEGERAYVTRLGDVYEFIWGDKKYRISTSTSIHNDCTWYSAGGDVVYVRSYDNRTELAQKIREASKEYLKNKQIEKLFKS